MDLLVRAGQMLPIQLYVFILLMQSVVSTNNTTNVVNIVAMESTGALDGGTTYYVRYLIPLFDMALKDAQEKFGAHLDIRFKHVETLCGPTLIGAQAAEEYFRGNVHVFLGPG